MKRLLAVSVVLLLALAGPAASTKGGFLVTNDSVGPLKLGMSKTQAQRALKRMHPGALRGCYYTRIKPGVVYRECQWYRPYTGESYYVGYLRSSNPSRMRVARITTLIHVDHTARGARYGMTDRRLYAMYGRELHCGQPLSFGTPQAWVLCRVGRQAKRHIVFVLILGGQPYRGTVSRIVVQVPGLKVPLIHVS